MERFLLRHADSGFPWSDQEGPVVFASRSEALVARRFMCEPAAYSVVVSADSDDLVCKAS